MEMYHKSASTLTSPQIVKILTQIKFTLIINQLCMSTLKTPKLHLKKLITPDIKTKMCINKFVL